MTSSHIKAVFIGIQLQAETQNQVVSIQSVWLAGEKNVLAMKLSNIGYVTTQIEYKNGWLVWF